MPPGPMSVPGASGRVRTMLPWLGSPASRRRRTAAAAASVFGRLKTPLGTVAATPVVDPRSSDPACSEEGGEGGREGWSGLCTSLSSQNT
eukprot:1904997-Rhodomonas_salina.1